MVLYNKYSLLIVLLLQFVRSWDLSHLGISKYSITHLSTHRNHAYISIISQNVSHPSLIQVPWPKNSIYSVKPRIFPSTNFHLGADCRNLQNVVSTEVDSFGRIWILDRGSHSCSGKLIVYNLFTQQVVKRFTFPDEDLELSSLIVDTNHVSWNQISYIGVSNKMALFICVYKMKKCVRYNLRDNSELFNKQSMSSTEDLALSKKDKALIITSKTSTMLHVVFLESITKQTSKGNLTIDAHYLGDKLGPSRGLLIIDHMDLVCYYLPRDYAIVCWNKKKPLMAESHEVLMQSYATLRNVEQLFLDNQYNLWAVNNPDEIAYVKKYQRKKFNSNYLNFKKSSDPTCIKITRFEPKLNIPFVI